jgi:hypothetical protein
MYEKTFAEKFQRYQIYRDQNKQIALAENDAQGTMDRGSNVY